MMAQIEREMLAAARALDFERAASLRDRLEELATQAIAAGAIAPEEAAQAGAVRRPAPPREAPRPRGRMGRTADGRPLGEGDTAVRTERPGPDVVPGEDPVRRRARGPKSMVPPRLKRKLR